MRGQLKIQAVKGVIIVKAQMIAVSRLCPLDLAPTNFGDSSV